MIRFRLLHIILLTLVFSSLSTAKADDVKKLTATYTHYGDSHQSLDECKRLALEGARLEALAKEFGKVMSNDTYSLDTNDGENIFSSLSTTEVRGEWIADTSDPKYIIDLDNEGHYVVTCTVSGQARALGNEAVSFEAATLRGSDLSSRTTSFTAGEQLGLYFRAPLDGYIAVYLTDASNTAYRLLPYVNDSDGLVQTRRSKEYVFFSTERADGADSPADVDELVMTTDSEVERNQIIVLFSPNRFTPPGMVSTEGVPASLSLSAFNKWLADARRRDTRMGASRIGIEIRNK
ncbi:MAG: DUF4384 domain-containing protein [Muribaculaceae bacterium]|jgi:hypothetical protein|nr:DUF4384 domain-containing protein [Muribaculaceae bacterium]